jgi:hypothetical protein
MFLHLVDGVWTDIYTSCFIFIILDIHQPFNAVISELYHSPSAQREQT